MQFIEYYTENGKQMATWVRDGCQSAGGWPMGSCVREPTGPHSTSPGKDPTSKFKLLLLLNVYCFCSIIKSKNSKSHHT